MRKGKKLLQFMLSEKGLAAIDELKERTEAASRAEVIRTAITFLWWGTEHIKNGRELVVIRSGDQVIEETVPLWELQSLGQYKQILAYWELIMSWVTCHAPNINILMA